MNKKILTLLASAALFCSCSNGVLESEHAQNAKPTLYVALTDYNDGTPVAGASVNLVSTGKKIKSSADGVAIFEKVNIGDVMLRIEAEGYATALTGKNVQGVTRAGETGPINEFSVPLFHNSATLEGYVQHTDSKGKLKGIDGLPVQILFSDCGLEKEVTEEVLTEEGKFKFENLPATDNACDYRIITPGAELGDQIYTAGILAYGYGNILKKGQKTTFSSIISADGELEGFFGLLNYNQEISYGAETTPVVFTFSENIAANQQGKIWISYYGAIAPAYNVDISGNTITLKPLNKWDEGNFIVYFDKILSESGKGYPSAGGPSGGRPVTVLSRDISGETPETPSLNPASYSIAYSTSTANISFKKIEGATNFRIYVEEESKLYQSCYGSVPSDPQIKTVTATCRIALNTENAAQAQRIGDNTNKITVQQYNAQYESKISAPLSVKETTTPAPRPLLGQAYGPIIADGKIFATYERVEYPYYDFQTLDEIEEAFGKVEASEKEYVGRVAFNRAMDQSKFPTAYAAGDCSGTACSRLSVEYKWLNEQVLGVYVKVGAGDALTTGTATITIKELTGKNGQPFSNGAATPVNAAVVGFSF